MFLSPGLTPLIPMQEGFELVRRINHVGSNVRSLLGGDDGEFTHVLHIRPDMDCRGCPLCEISAVGWQLDSQLLISSSSWPSFTVKADLAALSCRPPTVQLAGIAMA